MNPLLEIGKLRLVRETTVILDDVSWRVERGQNWVILGPNGSGKTSLLKVLAGYMSAGSGTLSLLGRTYGRCDWRNLRLEIGVVSSALQASIPPAEVALDTIISGRYAQLDLWARPTAADRRAARHWLRFFNCADLEERPWLFLSQGERQRILLARALMTGPKLLILDEPCAGLDPAAREDFLGFIDRLAARRRAPGLLLVTHHVEEITPSFSHALVLRKGRVIASGLLRSALTSQNLSMAFGRKLRLTKRSGRYRLTSTD